MSAVTKRSITVKDVDEHDLVELSRRAAAGGQSVQEYLRRVIAHEASRPLLPDELADMAKRRRAGRTPMSMDRFQAVRRKAAKR